MIKDMVVSLTAGSVPDVAASYATSVAGLFGAHLAAVAFDYEPAMPPMTLDAVPVAYIEALRAEAEEAAQQSIAAFENLARLAGLSFESRVLDAGVGGAPAMFSSVARGFDLSVVGQADPDKPGPQELIVEAALFDSGRPVLVVPYIQPPGLKLDRIMVCWDGSRNAARAIADALPFLRKAELVEIVIVEARDRKESRELPGADIAQHLARHDLAVDVERIVAPDTDVASILLSHAADSAADLMVMGGYGHSRFREFVLGGATRGIFSSMTAPVLMSH